MSKYHVYLADNWNKTEPFITEWDYELIGDGLRAEFDTYFAEQEKLANAGAGKTRQLFKGEYVKRFMVLKRVNLVDNPANGNLKSVFILRKDEKKLIDGRAKDSLDRYEYKIRENSDGTKSDPSGFLKFDLIQADPGEESLRVETFQVAGNDIEYFKEEVKQEPKLEEPKKEVEENKDGEFMCEVCGKAFSSKLALTGHSRTHKVNKEK